jgi:hypothetical protein
MLAELQFHLMIRGERMMPLDLSPIQIYRVFDVGVQNVTPDFASNCAMFAPHLQIVSRQNNLTSIRISADEHFCFVVVKVDDLAG